MEIEGRPCRHASERRDGATPLWRERHKGGGESALPSHWALRYRLPQRLSEEPALTS